jgi:hypothetical protein
MAKQAQDEQLLNALFSTNLLNTGLFKLLSHLSIPIFQPIFPTFTKIEESKKEDYEVVSKITSSKPQYQDIVKKIYDKRCFLDTNQKDSGLSIVGLVGIYIEYLKFLEAEVENHISSIKYNYSLPGEDNFYLPYGMFFWKYQSFVMEDVNVHYCITQSSSSSSAPTTTSRPAMSYIKDGVVIVPGSTLFNKTAVASKKEIEILSPIVGKTPSEFKINASEVAHEKAYILYNLLVMSLKMLAQPDFKKNGFELFDMVNLKIKTVPKIIWEKFFGKVLLNVLPGFQNYTLITEKFLYSDECTEMLGIAVEKSPVYTFIMFLLSFGDKLKSFITHLSKCIADKSRTEIAPLLKISFEIFGIFEKKSKSNPLASYFLGVYLFCCALVCLNAQAYPISSSSQCFDINFKYGCALDILTKARAEITLDVPRKSTTNDTDTSGILMAKLFNAQGTKIVTKNDILLDPNWVKVEEAIKKIEQDCLYCYYQKLSNSAVKDYWEKYKFFDF